MRPAYGAILISRHLLLPHEHVAGNPCSLAQKITPTVSTTRDSFDWVNINVVETETGGAMNNSRGDTEDTTRLPDSVAIATLMPPEKAPCRTLAAKPAPVKPLVAE